jgi:hypothetical protein
VEAAFAAWRRLSQNFVRQVLVKSMEAAQKAEALEQPQISQIFFRTPKGKQTSKTEIF